MLEGIECIFENMNVRLKDLDKNTYEQNFVDFYNTHSHYFKEILEYIEDKEDKEKIAKEVSEQFVNIINDKYADKKGKISKSNLLNFNLFMVYYVFTSILKTGHQDAKILCDSLCMVWNKKFKVKVSYTTFEEMHSTFSTKFFGISLKE
ncbi:MAG: hypothetical protein ACK5LV_02430 [Lachnospirales bacterium]